MNKKTTPDIGTRIRQLAAEISAIAEFAEGSIKKTASTYAADMAAYRAQYETGYKSFAKYIWAQVMAEA